MAIVETQGGVAAGVCATCGQPMTHVGSQGECMRCLVSFGFLSEGDQASAGQENKKTVRQGPLRYAHFEVEVNADGYPKILGAGAMAVTYCARDTILNSTVALKVIGRKLAENETARARFLREARAAASVQHPNVARVIHYGEQDGECFYAMELVHGETLEERVRREGPMPLNLALDVVEQTARGLAAGEAHGVIHRDLKPSNIMMEEERSGETVVKIIDYGVAKVLAADPTLQTQADFVGTPAFASPEQFRPAEEQSIDTRSDIYSLGVVFWYLITGHTPSAARSLEEMRAKQAEPLPVEQLKNAHVPPQVVGFLRSMLAVDPAARPQTALELVAALHRCSLRFEPATRLRRRHIILALGGLALLIGLASLAIFRYQSAQSSSALDRAIAVLPFENLSANADDRFLATGIQDEILTKLASLADLKVIARTSTQSYQTKPVDLRTVGQQLNVGRVLEGSLQRSGDKVRVNVQLIDTRTNTHLWASSYDRTLNDVFAVETEVANTIAQQLDANLVQKISGKPPTANVTAYSAYLRGLGIEHNQSNIPSFQNAAIAYAEAAKLDPNFALAWARLSMARGFLYVNGVARDENSALAVKEAADRAMALAPEIGEAWLAQGAYRSRVLGDRAAALEAYREAEKRLPNSAVVNEYVVYVECRLGHWKDAEVHLSKATRLDPRNLRLWSRAAQDVLRPLRRFGEAEAALDRALEISPDNEYAITAKAELFQEEGRLVDAANELKRIPNDSTDKYVVLIRASQALLERNFDSAIHWTDEATKSLNSGQSLSDQAIYALVLQAYCNKWGGRSAQARAIFDRVIHGMAPESGFVIDSASETRSLLALAYAGRGDNQKALEEARQAVADNENDAVIGPITQVNRAKVLVEIGDLTQAINVLPHLAEVPGAIALGELRYSPFWDPLRNDARFEALLKNPPAVRY